MLIGYKLAIPAYGGTAVMTDLGSEEAGWLKSLTIPKTKQKCSHKTNIYHSFRKLLSTVFSHLSTSKGATFIRGAN